MNDELMDLLTERALGSLTPEKQCRLRQLLAAAGLEDSDDVELAIAAAMNAFAGAEGGSSYEPIPDGLIGRLSADADRHFENESDSQVSSIDTARAKREHRSENPGIGSARFGQIGWAVAATLAVFLVVAVGHDAGRETLDAKSARAALIEQSDTAIVEWGASEIPAYNRVQGDVVWNDERQQGFLRLVGMPANDPAISQYQLWIIDPDRDANPVDGGVFDVPRGDGEVIIPINAKLDVSNPRAFAVTREQPGGVVVSDGPLLIVAANG
jgi:hypothetical protein